MRSLLGMNKLLHIRTSPRKAESASVALAEQLLLRLQQKHSQLEVTTIDLAEQAPGFLSLPHLQAFHAAEPGSEILEASDQYLKLLKASDGLIFSFPVWNFMIPASLKAWLDQVVRPGVAFRYQGGRPRGLITGKKVYLVLARGGVFPETYNNEPSRGYDFSIHYMKTVLGYIGVTDIEVLKAEGLADPRRKEERFQAAVDSIVV